MTDTDDWKATEFDKKDSSGPAYINDSPVPATSTNTGYSYGGSSNRNKWVSYSYTVPASAFGGNNYVVIDPSSTFGGQSSLYGDSAPYGAAWTTFAVGNTTAKSGNSTYWSQTNITGTESPVGHMEDGKAIYDVSNGFTINFRVYTNTNLMGDLKTRFLTALKYNGVDMG